MAIQIPHSRQTAIQRKSNRRCRPTWKVKQAGSWNQLLKDAGLTSQTPPVAQHLGVIRKDRSIPTSLTRDTDQSLGVDQKNASPAALAAVPADLAPIRKSFAKFSANNPTDMAKGGAPICPTFSIINRPDLEIESGLRLGFLHFVFMEPDAIEKGTFRLSHLNLVIYYWHFPNRLTPINKSLKRAIRSAYEESDWLAMTNAIRREFGQDIDGEQQIRFTGKFSELSYEEMLGFIKILESRGYYALDRDEWID